MAKNLNILAIVGPTASGKTTLAIDIAKQYNGEIIASDSRTVYKGMDIGTAKPTPSEQDGVPHWGFDLAGPNHKITAADFKRFADQKIIEIKNRGKLPILVGGSGLYIDAVVYDYSFAPSNQALRQSLEAMSIEQLQQKIEASRLKMPENIKNKRYLIRALERDGLELTKNPLDQHSIVIGVYPEKTELKKRIIKRVNEMIEDGVVDEIRLMAEKYGWESEAMTGGIYKVFKPYLEGNITLKEAIDKYIISDLHLAKKQITWFKRNTDIKWFKDTKIAKIWFDQQIKGKLV